MGVALSNQVALVTGASSDIGAGIAQALARAGAAVAIDHHSNGEAAARVVSEIAAAGGRAQPFAADVSDEARVAGLLEAGARTYGALDIVVANAGRQTRHRSTA